MFVNVEDVSDFDPSTPSPKVLDRLYKTFIEVLEAAVAGEVNGAGLLAIFEHLAARLPRVVATHGLQVEGLRKMLVRHAKRRAGAGGSKPPRVAKVGKRAAVAAANARASEAAELSDMSVPTEVGELTLAIASKLLKGRQTVVSADEYGGDEDGATLPTTTRRGTSSSSTPRPP